MVNKVHIYADVVSFVRLLYNSKIREGKDIKCILRSRAEIHLCISGAKLATLWEDKESILRKLCDAIDLPCPQADESLLELSEHPEIIYQKNPFAIWFLNLTDENITRFRDYYGVWVLNAETVDDEALYLHHHKEYDKDDVIEGKSDNGWKNFIEQLPKDKTLPPLNAIVINDRYLLNNTNEDSALTDGFYGLNNLIQLLDAILPPKLGIPFHLLIYCQHPKLQIGITDEIIDQFISDVQDLRDNYDIIVEFVYDQSRHKRTFHSNYFMFDIERGYNVFYDTKKNKLCGENDFTLESYMNNPNCSGDTNYEISMSKLVKIKEACMDALVNPDLKKKAKRSEDYGAIKRVDNSVRIIQNRLFP